MARTVRVATRAKGYKEYPGSENEILRSGPLFDERDLVTFGLVPEGRCFKLVRSVSFGSRDPQAGGSPLNSRRWSALSGTTLLVALAQSLCTAVLTISGVRVAIGLSALAAASGIYAPAKGFHQDGIRIPMLILAAVGAIVNLAVLAWIWHLRSRPAGQWRRRELSSKEKRSEKLQLGMAILTLVLVGLETWTHSMVHRTGPAPASVTQRIGT